MEVIPIKFDKLTLSPPLLSLYKAISWRIIGTATTTVIAYVLTGNMSIAGTLGAFEIIAKIILFYTHERLWGKIQFIKNEKPCEN